MKSVLVIGGGPAGSYSASALAREGFSVTLLESATFPRYHIGESLLPSCRHHLKFIDALDKVENHGFTAKPGAAVKFNQYMREGYTDFIALNPENGAWNVIRSEFDELLLKHAIDCGVKVLQGTRVTDIEFEGERAVSASWVNSSSEKGQTKFDWLVDASGRFGIMSTKYMKNRRFNQALKNVAYWAYWRGAGKYGQGTNRENALYVEALADQTGWTWFIPLHDGTVSVGVVMHEEASKRKRTSDTQEYINKTEHYLAQLKLSPGTLKILENATIDSEVKSAGDYSYSASSYAGPNFRVVGDAAAFIDPFFSSGIHMAFTGALSAAASIAGVVKGDCNEDEAVAFHNAKIGSAYTRFLLVVLGVYKQIRAETSPVMFDVDEADFDRAFRLLRPVIQGSADVNQLLTENELQQTMDFCANLFAPTTPEMHDKVASRVDSKLTSSKEPIFSPSAIENSIDANDAEARFVISEINARKSVHTMYDPTTNFSTEELEGFTVRLSIGNLGLIRAQKNY